MVARDLFHKLGNGSVQKGAGRHGDSANPNVHPAPATRKRGSSGNHSKEVVELLLEWCPDLRWLVDGWCRLLFRDLRTLLSSAGSPWTIPLRASMPPLTEKFRQTIKARMAAFSWARFPDSYARSVWYSRPFTRTRQV